MEQVTKDLRLVCLAALAWLHERDTGQPANMMNKEIDPGELAGAIDRLGKFTQWLKDFIKIN